MVQYKIPQNVGIEDKIVGPFSLRQLIILAIGGGISYTIFAISTRFYELNVLEYIVILLPALIALAGALIKINHVSFFRFILLLTESAIRPQKRHWDHQGIAAIVDPDLSDKKKASPVAKNEANAPKKDVNLKNLSVILDSGGYKGPATTHEDLDNVKDDDLITQAYFGHKRKEAAAENMYWRTRDVQKKKLEWLAKLPQTPSKDSAPGPEAGEENSDSAQVQAQENELAKLQNQKTEESLPDETLSSATEPLKAKVIPEEIPKKALKPKSLDVIAQKKEVSEIEVPPEVPSVTPSKPAVEDQVLEPNLASKTPDSQASDSQESSPPKKKRRRRRRRKKVSGPIREVPINTVPSASKANKKPSNSSQNTASLDDLSAGQTIEFNLD